MATTGVLEAGRSTVRGASTRRSRVIVPGQNGLVQVERREVLADPCRILPGVLRVVTENSMGKLLLARLVRLLKTKAEAAQVTEVICHESLDESQLAAFMRQHGLVAASPAAYLEVALAHCYNQYRPIVYYVWPQWQVIGGRRMVPKLVWENGHSGDLPELHLVAHSKNVYPAGAHLLLQ